MRKPLSLIIASTFITSAFIIPTASAQYLEGAPIENTEGLEYQTLIQEDGENETTSTDEEVTQNEKFQKIAGTISKITEETTGNYFATVEGEQPFGFYFNDKTLILDNAGNKVELEEGLNFTAFVDSSKAMIMIYPPKYSPDVVIVNTEKGGTVQLDQFDKNYLNKKQDLVIHVNKETSIWNLSGKRLSEDAIIDKEVLIFYEYVLESYPAQTGPSKVIVLEFDSEELSDVEKAYAIAEEDHYVVNGVKMIPLRLVAEQLGFKVESTGNGAIVSKGALTFTITRGSTTYGFNKALRQFEEAPALLETHKTYVPFELLDSLAGK